MIIRFFTQNLLPLKFALLIAFNLYLTNCTTPPKQNGGIDNAIAPIHSQSTPAKTIASVDTPPISINHFETRSDDSKKQPFVQNLSQKNKTTNKVLTNTEPNVAEKKPVVAQEKLQSKIAEVAPPLHNPTWFFESLDVLLQKFVSTNGQVNYRGLKSDEAELNAILKNFASNTPEETWTRNEKLAYWLNAYNAFTIKLILENYPLKKITDLDGGKTWDVRRIELGGKRYSLNQIENEIIRPQFKDARIHFAINCGAKSCPPLFNHPFDPAKLNDQLESRTRSFIRDEKFNNILADKIELSRIFDWYAADFGDTKTFLKKYVNSQIPDIPIRFKDYDWDLNE